ncbi:MAG: hypothetical protein FJX60_00695 [Alphaproteobacteria bacterium]|nr:hypothetical protein [Alphaproteobacteria bacterium]
MQTGIRKLVSPGLIGALLLSGCSFTSDALWPSLSGDTSRQAVRVDIPPSQAEIRSQQTLTSPAPAPQVMTPAPAMIAQVPAQPSNTFVGQKVAQMRGDLGRLQGSINQHMADLNAIRATTAQNAAAYYGTVAAIQARLQVGTTPGNPILQQQWSQAQAQLDTLNLDIANMNSLSTRVAADSSLAAFMLEAARSTYGLAGAVDEDHRALATLEDDVNRTVVALDRILNELNGDLQRQTAYLNSERSNLASLSVGIKNGELLGQGLGNRAFASAAPLQASALAAPSGATLTEGRRPLVVIRFDRARVDYQQALYNAVSRALERRPDAAFDLVAVSPSRGNAAQVTLNSANAKRNAETVLRSLTEMGLPATRVQLSSTTSGQAQNTEVHVYVR